MILTRVSVPQNTFQNDKNYQSFWQINLVIFPYKITQSLESDLTTVFIRL